MAIWRKIDQIIQVASAESYETLYERLRSAPPGYMLYFATHYAHADICNGGFKQYFHNSTGSGALDAFRGFKTIGANQRAFLVLQAMGTVKLDQPAVVRFAIDEEVKTFLAGYKKRSLDSLDDEYFELRDNYEALRSRYAERHWRELFGNDFPAPTPGQI